MFPADDARADNLIEPSMLAERRAKRAELAEEHLHAQLAEAQRESDRLQGRADALSGELRIAREGRDELTDVIDSLGRDLRVARQREHSERQLRVEIQDELAQARRDALGADEALRGEVRDGRQRAEEIERELNRRQRDLDHALGLIERHQVARSRAEAQAAESTALLSPVQDELRQVRESMQQEIAHLRAELDARVDLQDGFSSQVSALRDDVEQLRESHATDAAREAAARAALRDVLAAAGRMRERLEDARLQRAEAQELLASASEQLDERTEEVARLREQLEALTVDVAALRAQLHSERERTAAALEVADTELRARLAQQAQTYETTLEAMRGNLSAGPSPDETQLRASVVRLGDEIRTLRAAAHAQATRERELAQLFGEVVSTARELRAGYARQQAQTPPQIPVAPVPPPVDDADAKARPPADPEPRGETATQLGPADEQLAGPAAPPAPASAVAQVVVADIARAAQRLRAATPLSPQENEGGTAGKHGGEPTAPAGADQTPAPPAPAPVLRTVAPALIERRASRSGAPVGGPRPPAPERPPATRPMPPRTGLAPFVVGSRMGTSPAPWVTPALVKLAARDPAGAAEILIALIELQGRTGRSVIYDLTIPEVGNWRVVVHEGTADVIPDPPGGQHRASAFHVTGSVADVAVLGGGGPFGLGSGASVSGGRRHLRRLLRAGRDPVVLAEATQVITPGQALVLLAGALPRPAPIDRPLSVDLRTLSGEAWSAVADGGWLRTRAGGSAAPDAVLTGSSADLVALLGGATALGVSIEGDHDAARRLLGLVVATQQD